MTTSKVCRFYGARPGKSSLVCRRIGGGEGIEALDAAHPLGQVRVGGLGAPDERMLQQGRHRGALRWIAHQARREETSEYKYEHSNLQTEFVHQRSVKIYHLSRKSLNSEETMPSGIVGAGALTM